MDGITNALSSLGSAIKANPLQDINTLATIGSTGYNLYNQYQNQKYQNYLRDLATNPTKMNALARQYTQPLNAGLTASVGNQAQAYLAQRGLSDSPQISEQVEAQAIAPYIQQNQQQGYQTALEALGLGGGAVNPNLASANSIAALTSAFAKLGGLKQPGATATPDPTQIPSLLTNPRAIPDPYVGAGSDPGYLDPAALNPFSPSPTFPATPSVSLDGFYMPDYASAAS